MKKPRTISIEAIVNPVKELFTSDNFLEKVLNPLPLQEQWVTRLLAFSIDYILMILVTGITKDLIFPTGHFSFIDYVLLVGVVSLFYFSLTEAILGYTVGKRLFELKVVTQTGNKPELKTAFIRNISKVFFGLLILDLIANYLTTDNLNQRYVDKFAHTSVENW
ncbi:MAG: RDD family protein [Candidatus Bathyarchaeota archaeon]|nr:RDD family protein [Candidatus Bathyarchaeum sp.]